jgi:vacuolar-type H+-ATPase subunit I/STV1
MYPIVLTLHSAFRWLVLFSLAYALYRAYAGWLYPKPFAQGDHNARLWAVTLSHLQLVIGFCLYFISPIVKYYWSGSPGATDNPQFSFFAIIHMTFMTISVVILTIGSALSKRATTDQEKFSKMAIYFSVALGIILLIIPWAFSPYVSRPLFRF